MSKFDDTIRAELNRIADELNRAAKGNFGSLALPKPSWYYLTTAHNPLTCSLSNCAECDRIVNNLARGLFCSSAPFARRCGVPTCAMCYGQSAAQPLDPNSLPQSYLDAIKDAVTLNNSVAAQVYAHIGLSLTSPVFSSFTYGTSGTSAHVGRRIKKMRPELPRVKSDVPLVGFRFWEVWDFIPNAPILKALTRDDLKEALYRPGHMIEANLLPDEHQTYGAGIHAFKNATPEQRLEILDYMRDFCNGIRSFVAGDIALWGKVVEHEDGYRAQFGYPQKLYLRASSPASLPPLGAGEDMGKRVESYADDDVVRALGRVYGCEVV